MKTTEQVRRNRINLFLFTAACIILLAILCPPVHAKVSTVNSSIELISATENSLSWGYEYFTDLRPVGATLDGVIIEGWKTDLVYNYTANNLNPNSEHTFCIFGEITSNCESARTLESEVDKSLAVLFGYIFFIAAIICVVLGRWVPLFGLLGAGLSCIGIIGMIGVSFWAGFVFMVTFCAGVIIAFSPE